jgi:hypothetical protein
MPDDRQRHSRLSEVFARLFAARSPKSPASAGRHRGAAPAGPAGSGPGKGAGTGTGQRDIAGSSDLGAGHRITARLHEPLSSDAISGDQAPAAGPGGPLWPEDPSATTMELSRSAWELSDPRGREADRPDPMADTTLLSRVTLARPTVEPAEAGSGPDSGLDADSDAATDADTDTDTDDVDTDDAGTVADDADDTDADADADDPEPTPPWSVRSLLERHRRRLKIAAAGVAAVGILLALPPVRTQLRDSFTRLPQPYTALYFTAPPQVDGTVLTVPVSVHAVDTGAATFSVRVWTVDSKGQVENSKTADLKWDGQALSAVVSMPVNPQAAYVWAALSGSNETLHYKIAVA